MRGDRVLESSPPLQRGVDELQLMIRQRYPGVQFRVSLGDEDPSIVHITSIVDLDDPDEVMDLVIERMNELLVDDGLPIVVIPIRTPERVAADLQAVEARRQQVISSVP